MYESITHIIISTIAAFALLISTIGRTFKSRIDKNEAAITETRTTLFKEYATKNDVSALTDRIITQLDRIENTLNHKKDK